MAPAFRLAQGVNKLNAVKSGATLPMREPRRRGSHLARRTELFADGACPQSPRMWPGGCAAVTRKVRIGSEMMSLADRVAQLAKRRQVAILRSTRRLEP